MGKKTKLFQAPAIRFHDVLRMENQSQPNGKSISGD
jgi:hypothetical protein